MEKMNSKPSKGSKMMDMKCSGRMSMDGKMNLGKPRHTMIGSSGSIDSADKRGEGKACLK